MRVARLCLDDTSCEARFRGKSVRMRAKPFELLGLLAARSGQVVTTEDLAALWPPQGPSVWAVSSALREVRRSLAAVDAADGVRVEALRGRGYRLTTASDVEVLLPRALEIDPFVGRRAELDSLRQTLETAFSGHPKMVLVGGAAGIGKSRLAAELASLATARGGAVLRGGCREREDTAFRPWVEIVEGLGNSFSAGSVTSAVRPLAPELGRVLPAVRALSAESASVQREDPEMARLVLLDGFVDLFDRIAEERPCLVIVEDLHWADPSSLLVLRALATHGNGGPRLVIGTYRDGDVRGSDSVADAVAALDREESVEVLRLSPLSKQDSLQLLESLDMGPTLDGRRDEFCRVAGGNPFFLKELCRHVQEGTDGIALPRQVERLIRRRIDRRSREARDVLAVASVVGIEFRADLLRSLAVVDGPVALADALDELARARLIRPPSRPGHPHGFEHALTRQTAYDGIPSERRARLHLVVGERLEQELTGGEGETADSALNEGAASLARHFDAAAAIGGAPRALRYRRLAGAEAYRRFAFEQAAEHLRRASELFERVDVSDCDSDSAETPEEQHCALLIDLSNAARMAGDGATAERARSDALALARELDDPRYLARCAASALLMPWKNAETAALHEEALSKLSSEPTPLRAIVLAGLAQRLLDLPGTRPRRQELVREAIEITSASTDALARQYVLEAAFAALNAQEFVEERFGYATELLETGRAGGGAWATVQGHMFRRAVLLLRGQLAEARAELEEIAVLARRHPWPRLQWAATSLRFVDCFIDGRLEEAEDCATRAAEHAQRTGQRTGMIALVFQLPALRREQGRLSEILELVEHFATGLPRFAWGVDLVRGQAGDRAAVRRLLSETFDKREGLLGHDSDVVRIVGLCWLAAACAEVGESHHAMSLHDALAPAERSWAIAVTGFNTFGSVGRALGMTEALRGRWDRALVHFERAYEEHGQPGAALLRAWSAFDLAWALQGRGHAPDADRAARLLDEADAAAQRLGLVALQRRIDGFTTTAAEGEVGRRAAALVR